MAGTSKISPLSDRDIFYYRQRTKNRVFEALTSFFADEAERRGISKKEIAESLRRDPAQISRWLSSPSNLTLDTISDLLLSLEAEMDYSVAKFHDRSIPNEMHPLMRKIVGRPPEVVVVEDRRPKLPAGRFEKTTSVTSNSAVTMAITAK
jgi:transcriptional regulator with XRE-family HTH domain